MRLTPAALDANQPAWMPDSKGIVFSTRLSLWRLPVMGQNTPERLPFVGEDGVMPAVSRPPDGSSPRLAYIRSMADVNIWRIDTSAPARQPPRRQSSLSPPPDGRCPSFLRTADEWPSFRIAREGGKSGWRILTGPTPSSLPPWEARTQATPAGLPTGSGSCSTPIPKGKRIY